MQLVVAGGGAQIEVRDRAPLGPFDPPVRLDAGRWVGTAGTELALGTAWPEFGEWSAGLPAGRYPDRFRT
ncbi:hypothetical protein GCM10022225_61960 [Plantactinospora mayteni]|uniref:Uncharacterized protein n=1 Tax=Plantactinospora mayteni TaxID=566021 RepID=A0ABQ4EZK9_9ACTN|nr:hypothetical protein Pma05_66340 [Plantactinospora mayteni]